MLTIRTVRNYTQTAPTTYVVVRDGHRVDGFLSLERATALLTRATSALEGGSDNDPADEIYNHETGGDHDYELEQKLWTMVELYKHDTACRELISGIVDLLNGGGS